MLKNNIGTKDTKATTVVLNDNNVNEEKERRDEIANYKLTKEVARGMVDMKRIRYPEDDVQNDISMLINFILTTTPKDMRKPLFTSESLFSQYLSEMSEQDKEMRIFVLVVSEMLNNFRDSHPSVFLKCVNEAISCEPKLKSISKYLLGKNPALFAITEKERAKLMGRKKSRFEQGVDFCRSHPRFTVKWYKHLNKDEPMKYDPNMSDEDLLEKIIENSRKETDPFIQEMIKSSPYRQFRKDNTDDDDICASIDAYEEHLKKEQK